MQDSKDNSPTKSFQSRKKRSREKTFEEIEVSTKTIIAITNLSVVRDLDTLYEYIPLTPHTMIEKKRGRKKKTAVEQVEKILPEGSIIFKQYGNKTAGVAAKKKKKKNKTYFLHSVTVVVSIENNKFINIKFSSNGKLQITGCARDEQCVKTIKLLYKTLRQVEAIANIELITFKENSPRCLEVLINTVMQNMDYNIGFNISREKLDSFINKYTDYVSFYEGCISTSVNIKIKSEDPYDDEIVKLLYSYNVETDTEQQEIVMVKIEDYFELFDEAEIQREMKKQKMHTFLVFAPGSIIMSSRGPSMKKVFRELIDLITAHRALIEEKVEVTTTSMVSPSNTISSSSSSSSSSFVVQEADDCGDEQDDVVESDSEELF